MSKRPLATHGMHPMHRRLLALALLIITAVVIVATASTLIAPVKLEAQEPAQASVRDLIGAERWNDARRALKLLRDQAEIARLQLLINELEYAAILDEAQGQVESGGAREAVTLISEANARFADSLSSRQRALALLAIARAEASAESPDHAAFLRRYRNALEEGEEERERRDSFVAAILLRIEARAKISSDEITACERYAQADRTSAAQTAAAKAIQGVTESINELSSIEEKLTPQDYNTRLDTLVKEYSAFAKRAAIAIGRMHYFQKNDLAARRWIAVGLLAQPFDRELLDWLSKIELRKGEIRRVGG